MAIRFDVQSEIIWIEAKNLKEGAYAVQAHRLLVSEMGYTDGGCLDESEKGAGVAITVCETCATIKESKEAIQYIKGIMKKEKPTKEDQAQAAELFEQLYG